jgi:hypothetical protein
LIFYERVRKPLLIRLNFLIVYRLVIESTGPRKGFDIMIQYSRPSTATHLS